MEEVVVVAALIAPWGSMTLYCQGGGHCLIWRPSYFGPQMIFFEKAAAVAAAVVVVVVVVINVKVLLEWNESCLY